MTNPLTNHTDSLAELFHLNTKIVESVRPVFSLSDAELMSGSWGLAVRRFPYAEQIALPTTTVQPDLSLPQAIRQRRSQRTWAHTPISTAQLGTLLRLGAGIVRVEESGGKPTYHRAAPSGGARYPIELYPVVLRVSDVPTGIYHYDYHSHALDVLQQSSETEATFSGHSVYPEFIEGAAVGFLMTAVFERVSMKYSDRGYRNILLEAGHIAQNLCLLASSMKLGSLCMAGYYDQKMEQMLWLDGLSESVVYLVIVGHPQP